MVKTRLVTSESVGAGHPDKVADQISDAVLDAILAQDPEARVACETLVTTGLVVVAGEMTYKGTVDIPQVVRKTVNGIGYTTPGMGLTATAVAWSRRFMSRARTLPWGWIKQVPGIKA